MRSLKKRPRADTIANQERKGRSRPGRHIYFALLVVFSFAVANYVWGDLVMLRGGGLVLRDKTVIAATFVARVAKVDVSEGQTVGEGDTLLRIESTEVLERLAELSIRQAELAQQAATFQLRSAVARQLLPLAARRETETSKVLVRFDDMSDRGLLTSTRYEEALRANFNARQDRVKLATETETLAAQISALEEARADAARAVADLMSHYAGGVIRAPAGGTVGARVPSIGSVFRAGDPILSVYSGEAYVLTYLPRRYLLPIEAGMEVTVSSGRHRSDGVITDILPVSDALPREFQNTFKPRDRNQLARIRLADPGVFPVYEKVEIRCKSYLPWPLSEQKARPPQDETWTGAGDGAPDTGAEAERRHAAAMASPE
ncbi:HlyD family secretion protein [Rhodobium gokarnense]|uniref:Multidrug resistance efflux pump n=1 Tax=Rhodobium gokarnense TaxID=364296 RepID=A0ABT3HFQ9_9HYPH|nr:HlyD family efflux transporter periplasmic adaptor subunit [Rhodobium gokarnense]MCW2309106.1 multidrug resistance efflux pump [Rhodobium gokarnense]